MIAVAWILGILALVWLVTTGALGGIAVLGGGTWAICWIVTEARYQRIPKERRDALNAARQKRGKR